MLNDMKIKFTITNIKEYEIVAMRNLTTQEIKEYGLDTYNGLIAIKYKEVILTHFLSKEEEEKGKFEYLEYIKSKLRHVCEGLDSIENFKNADEYIYPLASHIASHIYKDGIWKNVDRTKESWDNFDNIRYKVKKKFENNEESINIYKELIKEANCICLPEELKDNTDG